MDQEIGQRQLRNDNAEIIRRVAAGESFTVTRNGKPVADLVPHQGSRRPERHALGKVQRTFRRLPRIDTAQWLRDRAEDDAIFGPDDPLEDPWAAG